MPHSSGGGHCGGGCHSGGYGGGSSRPMHRYFYHTPNGIKSLMAVEEPSENELRRYKTDLTILITTLSVIAAILLLVICFHGKTLKRSYPYRIILNQWSLIIGPAF